GATRDAITQSTGQLPDALGEFARGILAVLPERIVANAWTVFEKADILLLCCALGAAFSALLSRLDVATLAGGAAAVTVLLVMVNKPGPEGAASIVHMQWGPWVALAGAALVVVGARLRGAAAPSALPVDWSSPRAVVPEPSAAFGTSATSVAPPE
ncbi:MAG: hypothetical protein ACRDMZ_19510, partial [Solirubrobacteraceae bacterium]